MKYNQSVLTDHIANEGILNAVAASRPTAMSSDDGVEIATGTEIINAASGLSFQGRK
jgi:hypothetical protein